MVCKRRFFCFISKNKKVCQNVLPFLIVLLNIPFYCYEGKLLAETRAHVIILYSNEQDAFPLVEEILQQNVTGKTWIATSDWIKSKLYSSSKYAHILQGTMGFVQVFGEIPRFYEFLVKVKLQNQWSKIDIIHLKESKVNKTIQLFTKQPFCLEDKLGPLNKLQNHFTTFPANVSCSSSAPIGSSYLMLVKVNISLAFLRELPQCW